MVKWEWTNVATRVPGTERRVLVAGKDGFVEIGAYDADNYGEGGHKGYWHDEEYVEIEPVLWAELPKAEIV